MCAAWLPRQMGLAGQESCFIGRHGKFFCLDHAKMGSPEFLVKAIHASLCFQR